MTFDPGKAFLGYVAAVATGVLAFWFCMLPFALAELMSSQLSLFGYVILPIGCAGLSLLSFAFALPLALTPFTLFEAIAVALNIRSIFYFAICGGVIGLLTQGSFRLIGLSGGVMSANQSWDFFLGGVLGGLVFWWIVVRSRDCKAPGKLSAQS